MNFSQKHFLLFTFLKCNVVYLSKHSFPGTECRQKDTEKKKRRKTGGGAEEKKFKAYEVKLEGHSLSAFSLPA